MMIQNNTALSFKYSSYGFSFIHLAEEMYFEKLYGKYVVGCGNFLLICCRN